jgi:ribonuclease VapC
LAFVLDSSVIMAIVRGETGEDEALRLSEGAVISAVNIAEVVTKCVEHGYPDDVALEIVQSGDVRVIPFDEKHALLTGRLRAKAPKGVLSLGDRACIATAILQEAVAVTADRVWAEFDLGCKIELIR